MKPFRIGLSLASVVALLVLPAAARAQITIGQLAPGSSPPAICQNGPVDIWQEAVASGTGYEVPNTSGVITSWSTNAAAGAGQRLTFKVVRHFEGAFFVVGHDGPRDLTPGTVNTFKTRIPVAAGDILALNDQNAATVHNACFFATNLSEDEVGFSNLNVDTFDGDRLAQATGFPPDEGRRLNVQATFLEPPKVLGIGATKGPVTGGTPVTITGNNLQEVTSVTFAEVPATSVKEEAAGQITVVAPAVNALTDATVIVRTAAGSSTSLQSFTYEGCRVPHLKKKKLSEAKRRLIAGGCRLGKVKKLRGATAKKGKVVKQSPNPGGKLLAPGAKVNVTLRR